MDGKMVDLQGNNINYTAVALSALRRVPAGLRKALQEQGEWGDIIRWAMVGAVEGYSLGLSARETYNAAQRYIYQGLKAAGYRRPS